MPARRLLGGLRVWLACTGPFCVWVRRWAIAGRLSSTGRPNQLRPHSLSAQAQLRYRYLPVDVQDMSCCAQCSWPQRGLMASEREASQGQLQCGSVGLACRNPDGRIMASTRCLVANVSSFTSVPRKACAASWQPGKSAMPLGRLLQAGEG